MPVSSFESVLPVLIQLTARHSRRKNISAATNFVADLALNSLKVMDLMADVEDAFEIEIPTDELSEIRTVGDAAERVTKLLNGVAG